MVTIFLFIIGVCVGSFLGVVIDRVPKNKTIFVGHSQCDFCKHPLAWYDLIPVFSFITLFGTCRYCGHKLSFWYPIVEIITATVFVTLFYINHPTSISTSIMYFLDVALVLTAFVLAAIDYAHHILPDALITTLGFFSLIITILQIPHSLVEHLLTGIAAFLPLFLIFLFSKGRGMGFGDVKLAFVMGFLLGFPKIIIAYYVAFLAGGLISLILVISKKKKLHGGVIAFGPFLLFGMLCAFFWGNGLWIYSLQLLGF